MTFSRLKALRDAAMEDRVKPRHPKNAAPTVTPEMIEEAKAAGRFTRVPSATVAAMSTSAC